MLEDMMTIDHDETPLGPEPHADDAEFFGAEDELVVAEEGFEFPGAAIVPAFDDEEDLDDLDSGAEDEDDEKEMALLQDLGIDLDSADEVGSDRDLIAPLGEDDPYDDEMAA